MIILLYSETYLQRNSKGLIFFSFSDGFHFIQVTEVWILGTQDAQYCKSCSLKRGFRYGQVPFKTGFTVLTLHII